jgi:hypothetical protein
VEKNKKAPQKFKGYRGEKYVYQGYLISFQET